VRRIEADYDVTHSQEKCLTFSPRKRITVEQALAHDYLQPYHDPGAPLISPSPCIIHADPRASPLLQRTSRAPSRCRCRASSLTSSR
jgi:serine/threonine protein kinase